METNPFLIGIQSHPSVPQSLSCVVYVYSSFFRPFPCIHTKRKLAIWHARNGIPCRRAERTSGLPTQSQLYIGFQLSCPNNTRAGGKRGTNQFSRHIWAIYVRNAYRPIYLCIGNYSTAVFDVRIVDYIPITLWVRYIYNRSLR